jgi:hypothetical protein
MSPLLLPLAIACAAALDLYFIYLGLLIRSGKSPFKPPRERPPYVYLSIRGFIFALIFVHFLVAFNFAVRENVIGIALAGLTCAPVCAFLLLYWRRYQQKFIDDEIFW